MGGFYLAAWLTLGGAILANVLAWIADSPTWSTASRLWLRLSRWIFIVAMLAMALVLVALLRGYPPDFWPVARMTTIASVLAAAGILCLPVAIWRRDGLPLYVEARAAARREMANRHSRN